VFSLRDEVIPTDRCCGAFESKVASQFVMEWTRPSLHCERHGDVLLSHHSVCAGLRAIWSASGPTWAGMMRLLRLVRALLLLGEFPSAA